ncbi:MAG TPA: hemerythrin domain-containing protein [Usitatibacter sp.]|nr:hemerythrin domain-containing protein [Usitatibacter sp.]
MRLFDAPAAGFDHPLEILEACHGRVLRFAGLTVRIARQVAASGVDDEVREAARSVMRYFDDAGAKHHRDEEEDLFPALNRCVPDSERPALAALVTRLLDEHRELDGLWRAMREHLQALVEGRETALDPGLAEAFVEAYRRHIELEERELFPLARRLLDGKSIRVLGASMAQRRGVAPHLTPPL